MDALRRADIGIDMPVGEALRTPIKGNWPNFLAFPAFIEVAGTSGSGFSITDGTSSYLVSAAHVLFKDKREVYGEPVKVTLCDALTHNAVVYELDCQTLYANNCLLKHRDSTVDVAVCKVGLLNEADTESGRIKELPVDGVVEINHPADATVLGLKFNSFCLIDKVLLCESVLLLSHPTSLTNGDPALSRGYPLMRSGMVAGKPPGNRIIIDCPTYPGNSGGLVLRTSDQSAIGVAIRNIGFSEKLYSSVDRSEVSIRRHNSGFTVVEPMDRVLDIVQEMTALDCKTLGAPDAFMLKPKAPA